MAVPRPPLLDDARRRVADEASIVALVALERWIGLGLPHVRSPDGARRFDPVEVIDFFKHAGRALGDAFVPRAVAQSRALVLAFHEGTPSVDAPPRADALPRTRF